MGSLTAAVRQPWLRPAAERRKFESEVFGEALRLRRLNSRPITVRHVAVKAGIHIDRRRHLEESFRRQQERDLRTAEAEVSCPVDCVREVCSLSEFERELQEAEAANELVVVDFYNSACGACKYILPQFVKMCKKGCGEDCQVDGQPGAIRFIKHNVRDEYDDLTDIARFYKIKVVPMFTFFMDGCRVEQFPTRDQSRLTATIGRLLRRYHEVGELSREL